MNPRDRFSRLRSPRRIAATFGVVAALAVLAGLASQLIGASRVDVGVDLYEPAATPLRVGVRAGDGTLAEAVELERVSDAFAPRWTSFELTATGERSADAKGAEVWLLRPPKHWTLQQDPPGSWLHKPEGLVTGRPQSRVSMPGGEGREIELLRHPWSGIARVRSGGEERTVDLYDGAGGGTVKVPLATTPLVRYRASVPRRWLQALALDVPESARIRRLYVGSLVPSVYFADDPAPEGYWGRVVSGWTPARTGGLVALPPLSRLERGGFATFGAVFAALLLAAGLAGALGRPLWRLARDSFRASLPQGTLAPFRPGAFLSFFVAIALAWSVALAAFHPGVMTSDSTDQWEQVQTMRLKDAHPVAHTLTMKLVSLAWNSPAAVALAQVLAIAALLAFGLSLLLRAGVSRKVVAVAFLAALLSPRNAITAITLWKDVLFSAAVLGLTILTARAWVDERARAAMRSWVLLGVALGLVALYRHNGVLLLVGMPPLLLLAFWRDRKRVLVAVAVACAMVGAMRLTKAAMGVVPLEGYGAMVFGWRVAPMVDQDVPFSPEEYRILSAMRSLDDRWAYTPGGASPLYFDPERPFKRLSDKEVPLTRISLDLIGRYPLLWARHVARSNAFVFWPPSPTSYWLEYVAFGVAENKLGVAERSLLPRTAERLKALVLQTREPQYAWLFWRPALMLYLVLLAAAVALWRTRDVRVLVAFAPVLVNTAGIVIAGASQDMRYQFPLTLAGEFLVCLCLLPRPRAAASAGSAPAGQEGQATAGAVPAVGERAAG